MVFAINKIDKPAANPDHIKEQLSQMNYLVESWGGKYQDQEVSAKKGLNLDKLLEKVLLEAEMLDLKANPNRYVGFFSLPLKRTAALREPSSNRHSTRAAVTWLRCSYKTVRCT